MYMMDKEPLSDDESQEERLLSIPFQRRKSSAESRISPEGAELELPPLTEMLLRELRSFRVPSPYWLRQSPYWLRMRPFLKGDATLSNGERLAVARAMAIEDRTPSAFDELAAVLMGRTIGDKTLSYRIRDPKGKSALSWDQFLQGPLSSYLEAGRSLISLDSADLRELHLVIEGLDERIDLALSWRSKDHLLRFSARGTSRLKQSALNLAAELNLILEDYRNRLQWAEELKAATPRSGFSEAEIDLIRYELDLFSGTDSSLYDFSGLRPGASFGDDPLELGKGAGKGLWGFYSRCRTCEEAVAMEVFDLYESKRERPWDKLKEEDMRRRTIIEATMGRKLSEIHGTRGCSGTEAVSSRTGKVTPIREID